MKDSPNGKRYGRRDAKGRIVEAYGFDLSPLAARHGEFVRLAEEGRAEREAMGRLRRRATIARKGIVQILETVRDYDLSGEDWVAWALASTPDEREQLLGIHRTAVEKTMQYVAEEIGHTRRGGKNNRRTEPGDIAWIGFHHYTARPVGQDAADPQIHTHN